MNELDDSPESTDPGAGGGAGSDEHNEPAGEEGEPELAAAKFYVDRSHYREALQQWMASTMEGHDGLEVTDIEIPVATGFSNETVLVDVAWTEGGEERTGRYVVRIEPTDGGMFPHQTPQCALSVEVQYRVMKAVQAAGVGVPLPPLLGYEPDTSVLGRPFFVMGFIDGRIAADVPRYTEAGFIVEDASPEERRRLVLSSIGAMAGVHAVDWRSGELDWLDPSGRHEPTTALQVQLYREHVIDELAGREHPVLYAALDWLAANDPHDERVGLTWGDARLGNIITSDDYRPAAILDWEVTALSPTEADVGWWLMFDRMSFDDMGIARLEGYPTREEMIDHYEEVSGCEVRNPHYWEVFGAMRFCTIFIRLMDRMVAAGLIPAEVNASVGNMVTTALANLLEIDNPIPDLLTRS